MEVRLTIYNDEKRFFLGKIVLPCVIGRGKQCDLAILQPLISRRHCEIFEENGRVMARDLGSLNGTFFQEAQIGRGTHIPYGSFFSIGQLCFRIDTLEESDPSVSEPIESAAQGQAPSTPKDSPSSVDMRRQMLSVLQDLEREGASVPNAAENDIFLSDKEEDSDVVDLEDLLKDE